MPVHVKFEAEWVGHALELPYALDNMEAAIGEALWRFLMPDLLLRDKRNIRVAVTELSYPDLAGKRVLGMRLHADGSVEVFDEDLEV